MLNIYDILLLLLPGQVVESVEDPGQLAPPFRGAGLLHKRDLDFNPVALLHDPQELHGLQPPSTVNILCVENEH